MPKPTKSSGIRMPTETFDWIDRLAATHGMNRSQCVCRLLKVARESLASKPKPKQPWTVNVAWVGYSCSSIVTVLSLIEFISQF